LDSDSGLRVNLLKELLVRTVGVPRWVRRRHPLLDAVGGVPVWRSAVETAASMSCRCGLA
jgi:hypothetical protein